MTTPLDPSLCYTCPCGTQVSTLEGHFAGGRLCRPCGFALVDSERERHRAIMAATGAKQVTAELFAAYGLRGDAKPDAFAAPTAAAALAAAESA